MCIKLLQAFLIFITSTTPAFAALIDYGSYTLDTNTGLDWYDLSLTQGMSVTEAEASVGQGYQAATMSQFRTFMSNYVGPITGTAESYGGFLNAVSTDYLIPALNVINAFGGPTVSWGDSSAKIVHPGSSSFSQLSLLGYLSQPSDYVSGEYAIAELTAVTAHLASPAPGEFYPFPQGAYGRWGAAVWGTFPSHDAYGVYLVRKDENYNVTATPLPASLPLFGSAVVGIVALARRKNKATIKTLACFLQGEGCSPCR